ncbi:MAG: biotin/lipoyl-containing protein [Deltaproteobacteria bacterium]|nr:biotin/lipoyl-containing protein [Deltaproteobacteria bacterium]
MAEKIIMPQAGQDITEGRVVKWLKAEGDTVKKDEAICEVETEKVVFEVESPGDGVLYKIIVPDGEKVKIFATIGILAAPGETVDVEAFLADEQEDKKRWMSPIFERNSARRRKPIREGSGFPAGPENWLKSWASIPQPLKERAPRVVS